MVWPRPDRRRERQRMIDQQIIPRGVFSAMVHQAMLDIPRELFVPREYAAEAYADCALPIGLGQTVSQPYTVAMMTESLELSPGDSVLEIGTGSGYQAAILAKLAREVYTVERLAPLLDAARKRLETLGIGNVHCRLGDGTLGWPEFAPFDRIIITAAGPDIPRQLLLSQLRDGGVAVLPAGSDECQTLWRVRRDGTLLEREDLGPFRFVRLIGDEGWGPHDRV